MKNRSLYRLKWLPMQVIKKIIMHDIMQVREGLNKNICMTKRKFGYDCNGSKNFECYDMTVDIF